MVSTIFVKTFTHKTNTRTRAGIMLVRIVYTVSEVPLRKLGPWLHACSLCHGTPVKLPQSYVESPQNVIPQWPVCEGGFQTEGNSKTQRRLWWRLRCVWPRLPRRWQRWRWTWLLQGYLMSAGRRSRLSPEVLDDLMVVNILGKLIQYYYCRPGWRKFLDLSNVSCSLN